MATLPTSWLLWILFIFVALAYALIVWQRERVYRAYEFLTEVKAELKKVTWPNRKEVIGTTGVVILTVFFFGIYLSIIDVAVTWARSEIFKAAGVSRGPL